MLALGSTLPAGCTRDSKEFIESVLQPRENIESIDPVQEAELDVAVDAFMAASARGDVEGLADMVDFDALLTVAVPKISLGEPEVRGMLRGLRRASKQFGFVHDWASWSGEHQLKVLGYRVQDAESWATIRLITPDGAFDHLKLRFARVDGGQPKIVDFETLSTGHRHSESLAPLATPLVRDLSRKGFDRLTEPESPLMKHAGTLRRLGPEVAAGNYEGWTAIWKTLPPEIRDGENLLLTRVRLAASQSEEVYGEAIEALRQAYPDSPASLLASVDYHAMKEDYHAAAEAMAKVRATAMPDPYMKVLEGTMRVGAGEYDEAVLLLKGGLESEAQFEDGHWLLITAQLAQEDHAGVRESLLNMARQFEGLEFELEGEEVYADFVASPEYPRFLAEMKALEAERAAHEAQ